MQNFLKIFIIVLLLLSTACNKNQRTNNQIPRSSDISDENYKLSQMHAEPYYKYAWHFAYNQDFGEHYYISPQAHINIEKAWEITRGAGVIVAVIDASNFDWEHEDLRENVIRTYNSDENNNHIKNQGESDESSHGTTVAGFIASPINGKGLVGAAPRAKLILIKQIDSSDSATIKAFQYAKQHGAKVINCSWGTDNVSQGVSSALQDFKDDGITIIFASGNLGANMDYGINDESELDSVIGIGSSNEYNDIAKYSNYGENIDLLSPGGNIEYLGILGLDDSGAFGSYYQRDIVNNNYAFANGTSFSAPITAGVVALMLSANQNLNPYQVREILINSADKIGDDANYKDGFDKYRAYGKLNAGKAVQMAKDYF